MLRVDRRLQRVVALPSIHMLPGQAANLVNAGIHSRATQAPRRARSSRLHDSIRRTLKYIAIPTLMSRPASHTPPDPLPEN
jgi:hypothetical protein